MENKINIAELLKDCPSGMELDCLTFDNVFFQELDWSTVFPIICYRINNGIKENMHLTEFGSHFSDNDAKCIIFPKGKTSWEGFNKPFEDGDILISGLGDCDNPFIFKQINGWGNAQCYCAINCYKELILNSNNWTPIKGCRLATDDEKQKLFDFIKAKGYKWNAKTKTLEKLIVPKFKVGDRITKRCSIENWIVSSVSSEYYGLKLPKGIEGIGVLPVVEQDDWELVFDIEPKFKVGDRIVHKVNKESPFTITEITDTSYKGGYIYEVLIEQQDNFELVPNKFDINNLNPFDKVLMRSSDSMKWTATYYSHKEDRYFVGCGLYCIQCIPYEGNEHLIGKTDDCNDFYKTW